MFLDIKYSEMSENNCHSSLLVFQKQKIFKLGCNELVFIETEFVQIVFDFKNMFSKLDDAISRSVKIYIQKICLNVSK